VELCNNLVENAIRPTKLGAKNWMFFGSERGGRLAAVAFTLIENCKRQGLDLREYLIATMKRLVEEAPVIAAELSPEPSLPTNENKQHRKSTSPVRSLSHKYNLIYEVSFQSLTKLQHIFLV